MFQTFHLVDELTAVENVELPALLIGASRPVARRRAAELLDHLGVADRAGHLPSRLSGGQQQRVALARAVINAPTVVLADEPTGSLDSRATGDILRLLGEMRDPDRALVVVTHDPRIATTADRLASMGDGRIFDETRLGDGAAPALASLTELTD